jgi:hypothetical protein
VVRYGDTLVFNLDDEGISGKIFIISCQTIKSLSYLYTTLHYLATVSDIPCTLFRQVSVSFVSVLSTVGLPPVKRRTGIIVTPAIVPMVKHKIVQLHFSTMKAEISGPKRTPMEYATLNQPYP